jgi:TolB protein
MMASLRRFPRIFVSILSIFFYLLPASLLHAQDWVRIGSGLGNQRIRIAAADFKPVGGDPQVPLLKATFDATLYNDLSNAGIFDMVSKSLAPTATPGSPQEINLAQWSADPANASMVALGALSANNGRLAVFGWVLDAKNSGSPQVLGKQYNEAASQDNARMIAHRFADEIIARLSGLNGIAETKIYFVSARGGSKQIWAMDYDGQSQHLVVKAGDVSLSPRISPDNSRLAFSSLGKEGWAIRMFSLDLGRMVAFPGGIAGGSNLSPSWSGDGNKIAFSSSRSGDPEIWVCDSNGGNLRKLTAFRGPDVSPTWNPKTNEQIAWVSGRTGLPQVYIMDAGGANVQRMTDQGYAVSPSWSPSGQFLAFSWDRKYGPGAPGGRDIYVMDIASLKWIQLTHDAGVNDFPSWAPDGRHLVFQRDMGRESAIWTMLADGTEQHELTRSGKDSMPNWSWK